MAGGVLCCFVVANRYSYDFYALDIPKASGKGDDDQNSHELDADDLSKARGEGDDLSEAISKVGGDDDDDQSLFFPFPRLPQPFLILPKFGGEEDAYNYPQWMAFGLLDEMLYMVSPDGELYVFDTRKTTIEPQQPLVPKDCVTKLTDLNDRKPGPIVVPAAGKLFVFCEYMYPGRKDTDYLIEVFDPKTNCCSPIVLPPALVEFAKVNPCSVLDCYYPPRLDMELYRVESHAAVGSSIVLSLCGSHNVDLLFVLDAETLLWNNNTHQDQKKIPTSLPFVGGCIYWDGIWCSGQSWDGVLIKQDDDCGDIVDVPLPSEEVVWTDGKVARADDRTLLLFSYAMRFQNYAQPCPDYFKLDMLTVDKTKSDDKDGVEKKLTYNVVKTMEFSFQKYYPSFQLAFCYCLMTP